MDFMPPEPIKPELNIVTLLDVVLLLLIFFMLTTSFVLQSGIQVKLPEAAATKVESTKEITVTITKDNQIYLNQQKVSAKQLPQVLKETLARSKGKKLLVVRADKQVLHGTVVKVMDLSKRLGVDKLAIATEASR